MNLKFDLQTQGLLSLLYCGTWKWECSTLPCNLCTCLAEDTTSSLLPVNNSQREYCISNDGDILLAGDSWKPNACTSCICNNGTIQCFSQRCPAAKCKVPVLRKGQCCPRCLGKSLLAWWKLLIRWCILQTQCNYWHHAALTKWFIQKDSIRLWSRASEKRPPRSPKVQNSLCRRNDNQND